MSKCACGHLFSRHTSSGCRESSCSCTYGTYAQTNQNPGNQSLFDPLDMMISDPVFDIESIDKQVQMAFPCYVKNDQSWNEIEILWDEFHELYENKKWTKILEVTDKIIQIKPDDQYAYMYKAYALDELKQYEEAIRCLDASLDIDDKYDYDEAFRMARNANGRIQRRRLHRPMRGRQRRPLRTGDRHANPPVRRAV